MSNYDKTKDETFEREAWSAARTVFSGNHDPANFQPFLKDYTTPESARSSVVQAQKEANSEYNGKLGAILDKVDQFMKVGDLAIKSAPESIGLAWTGIRLCLHSVQDDFATFSLFSGACADILGILISCRVYGGLYASQDHPPDFTDLHEKVLSYIKETYVNIIEFSYQMWKYARSNTGVRVIKGLFRSAQGKFQPKIKAIKDNEAQMNKYASQANQQVSQYYQKKGLDNDQTMMRGLSDQMEMLQALQEEAAKQNQLMEELMKRDELHRKDQRMTAAEITHENWERQKKELPSLDDNQQVLDSKLTARKPGTCGWILENTKFQDYVKAEGGNVTWLVGTGGSGKSFLMSVVIENLKNNAHRHDSLVHYFFISKGSQATMQADQIERHLLAQLYQDAAQSLDILDKCNKIMAEYIEHQKKSSTKTAGKKSGDGPAGFEQTYTALAKIINKRIYLMIDALDECADRETQEFIQTIKKLASTQGLKVNVYCSSRDEPDIAVVLENCPSISVEENNSKDIAEHVQAEMAKLPGFTPAERDEACREITQKAGCYFRYVELAMDFMRRPWRRPLSSHLESLPSGVENIYAQRLNQTNPAYYDLLTHCLTWTILAGEELSVQELIDGYKGSFTDEESSSPVDDDRENVNLELYEDQIRQAGSGFLRVNPDHTVSLVHNTVRDFFLQPYSVANGSARSVTEPECQCARCQKELKRSKKFVVSEREGHMQIITTILQHLLSPSFQRKYYAKPRDKSPDMENEETKVSSEGQTAAVKSESDAPLVDAVPEEAAPAEATQTETTPAEAQGEHIQSNGVNAHDQSPDDRTENLDDAQQAPNDHTEEAATKNPPEANSEPVVNGASGDLDFEPATPNGGSNHTQENGSLPNGEETQNTDNAETADGTADDHSVVDSDKNVDLTDQDRARLWDLQSDSDRFPARYEVSRLRWHLTQLEDIYPANERSGDQWSKLRELLDRFLDPGSETWKGWIRTLCAAGLSVDSMDMYIDDQEIPPLVFAACCGLTSVAHILLARPNASDFVNLKMPEGMSVSSYAVAYQMATDKLQDAFLLAMLEAGADPNTYNHWDEEYVGTTFHFLLTCRTVTLAQLHMFLAHGADINTLDETGHNSLHFFAMGESDLEIGEALVEAGADIQIRNSRGESIMHLLARRDNCRVDIMQYFIDKGAEVDTEDDASERPLLEAATAGNCDAVKLLLDHGADIEDVNQYDQTALFAAALAGNTDVVKVLLERGADPLKRNSMGATPFGMACRHGDAESALLLGKAMVEKGEIEHLNWQNISLGKTPIMRAASRGISNVIDFILDHVDNEAALTTVSKKGWSALHYAALRARPEATMTLLKHGADSRCKDLEGKTPLQLCYAKIWTKPDEDREKTISALIDHDQQAAIAEIELLHTLAINDSPSLVAKLLEYGANPYATDEHGWNVLQLAEQYDRPDVVEVIKTCKLKAGSRPSRFVGSFSDKLVCSPCGLEIELLERGKPAADPINGYMCYATDQTLITEHPIPASAERYYFEMTIADREDKIIDPMFVIGITQKPTGSTKLWFPGWSKPGTSSWGYHSDDGKIWCVADPPKIKDLGSARKYGYGDTAGCGIDVKKRTVFWTLNGERLMEAGFQNVRGQIYPVVALSAAGKVKANLGLNLNDEPFLWQPGITCDFESDVPSPALRRLKSEH